MSVCLKTIDECGLNSFNKLNSLTARWGTFDYKSEETRNLAELGFYQSGERIRCWLCEIEITDIDDPWKEHVTSNCILVRAYLQTEQGRLSTYMNWNHTISPKKMSDAGFLYTGERDIVECLSCGLMLCDWSANDDPLLEHKSQSNMCNIIRELYGV